MQPIIGEGRFRIAVVRGEGVEKTHKSHRVKNYGLFKVRFPLLAYIRTKYGVRDLNLLEQDSYRRHFADVPDELRPVFPRVLDVSGEPGRTVLRMEAVRNTDGEISKAISAYPVIGCRSFWVCFETVMEFLNQRSIPLMDLQPRNLLVRWLDPQHCLPAIVDYKCVSGRLYPFQPATWFHAGAMQKMNRRAQRIREQFRPPMP